MFKVLMICAIFGLAVASPLSHGALRGAASRHTAPVYHHASHSVGHSDDVHAEVLSRKDDVRADGFDSGFETSNHITRSESGDEHGNIHGNFAWISPEGEHVDLTYVADENGYQPQSAWLPTPPPIPADIQRALAYLAKHAPAQDQYNH